MGVLLFPKNEGVKESYYRAYYESIRRSAVLAGLVVHVIERTDTVWCGGSVNAYSCTLEGKQFIMDFSDLKPFQLKPGDYNCPYFKWHYCETSPSHTKESNVSPLCVLQDYDWREFCKIRKQIHYDASGQVVTNNQRIRAAARDRRARVRQILRSKYGGNSSFEFLGQSDWWLSHNTALVAVHVPGARNDMLDRGQLELMGLGVSVVSPRIVTVLAGNQWLVPFKHYVPVAHDYSNLVKMIEWCLYHRNRCKQIGKNAQQLFDSIVPPHKYWGYIRKVLHEF